MSCCQRWCPSQRKHSRTGAVGQINTDIHCDACDETACAVHPHWATIAILSGHIGYTKRSAWKLNTTQTYRCLCWRCSSTFASQFRARRERARVRLVKWILYHPIGFFIPPTSFSLFFVSVCSGPRTTKAKTTKINSGRAQGTYEFISAAPETLPALHLSQSVCGEPESSPGLPVVYYDRCAHLHDLELECR